MYFVGAEVTERPVSVWSVRAVVLGDWHSMYEKPEHNAALKVQKKSTSLYTPWRHIEGVAVELQSFLTSALDASVQSTTGSRGVHISGSNVGYNTFRGSVKSTGYPLHSPVSPSLPLPCVTVCHHISTGLYASECHHFLRSVNMRSGSNCLCIIWLLTVKMFQPVEWTFPETWWEIF
jgi:hypothetical protein